MIPYIASTSVRFFSIGTNGGIAEATNCVTLHVKNNPVVLEVNGSTGPVLGDGGEVHLVATGLPVGSVAHAILGCDPTTAPEDLGQVIGADGTFDAYIQNGASEDFSVWVAVGWPTQIFSNCVSVHIVPYLIDPVLTVNGSQTPDPISAGSYFDLAGSTFSPDTTVSLERWPGSSGCVGGSNPFGATTDNDGSFSLQLIVDSPGYISFRGKDQNGNYGNCVTLLVTAATPTPEPATPTPTATVAGTPGPITLTANGSTVPVAVDGGTRVDFQAAGLAGVSYTLRWYAAGDCTGTAHSLGSGPGSDGSVGAATRYVESTIGVNLQAGERTSNCVQVSWRALPPTSTATTIASPTSPVATATATSTGPDVTATVSPTDPAATSTLAATVPATATTTAMTSDTPTATVVVTGTSAVGVTPTPTATNGAVSGLPVTGGAPTHGSNPPLTILLAAVAAFVLGLSALFIRRSVRR